MFIFIFFNCQSNFFHYFLLDSSRDEFHFTYWFWSEFSSLQTGKIIISFFLVFPRYKNKIGWCRMRPRRSRARPCKLIGSDALEHCWKSSPTSLVCSDLSSPSSSTDLTLTYGTTINASCWWGPPSFLLNSTKKFLLCMAVFSNSN